MYDDGSYRAAAKLACTDPMWGSSPPLYEGSGELEAAACRSCGYVETYLKDPASVPVDGELVRLIGSA